MNDVEDIVAGWERFFAERIRRRQDLKAGYLRHVDRLARSGLPPIFEFRHLSELVGIGLPELAQILTEPDSHYRTYALPKRSGGVRSIDVPSPILLSAQRWVSDNILENNHISESAHGFVFERSVLTNVSPHIGSDFILKMDIKDFFPSILQKRGIAIFLRMGYAPNVAYYLSRLCFYRGRLPQGAATSPSLSNIVARRLDARLRGLADRFALKYTRYADDMTFSGRRISGDFIGFASEILASEGFQTNAKKTRISGPKSKKIVTGISISSGKARLPRDSVRYIKQQAYYLLKFGYFESSQRMGTWDPIFLDRLVGKIGFWLQIEPENKTAIKLNDAVRRYRAELEAELNTLKDISIEADSLRANN